MNWYKQAFVIEGVDRTGKSGLIENIQQELGYYNVIHCQKPKLLRRYSDRLDDLDPLYVYQLRSFEYALGTLSSIKANGLRQIYDRSWIGEAVYSNIYRGYDGNYVFNLEKEFRAQDMHHVRLILLTENFSISNHFKDDGLSFDVSKREEEQNLFLKAFEKSILPNKKIICVTAEDGSFRDQYDILEEAIS